MGPSIFQAGPKETITLGAGESVVNLEELFILIHREAGINRNLFGLEARSTRRYTV